MQTYFQFSLKLYNNQPYLRDSRLHFVIIGSSQLQLGLSKYFECMYCRQTQNFWHIYRNLVNIFGICMKNWRDKIVFRTTLYIRYLFSKKPTYEFRKCDQIIKKYYLPIIQMLPKIPNLIIREKLIEFSPSFSTTLVWFYP